MLKKIVLLWLFCTPVFANTTTEAMNAYDKGDFKGAISSYQSILKEGARNGSVYYNMGNAYFRLGEKGNAIAAYLAARSLLPRNPDVRANLKFVQEQTVDKLSNRDSSLFRDLAFWVDMTTPKELLYLSAILICLALSFLFFSLVVQKLAFLRMWSLAFSFIASLGFCVFATSLYYEESWGAVVSALAEIRSGPGEQNTVVFQLHEGAPFVLEAMEGGWYRIRLSDGKMGWISAKDASVFLF